MLPNVIIMSLLNVGTLWGDLIVSSRYSCSPRNSQCTIFGDKVFAVAVKSRGSHTELGCALNLITGFVEEVRTYGGTENTTWKWKQRLEWSSYQPKNVKDFPKLPGARRSKEGLFQGVLWGSMALLTLWFHTCSLKNYERVTFCCSKSSNLQ